MSNCLVNFYLERKVAVRLKQGKASLGEWEMQDPTNPTESEGRLLSCWPLQEAPRPVFLHLLEEFEGRNKAHDIIFEKLFNGNSVGDVI